MTRRVRQAAQRERIHELVGQWMQALGLTYWHIHLHFVNEPLEKRDIETMGWNPTFEVETNWHYLDAAIRVSLPAIEGASDRELEESVLHELLHVILSELREGDEDRWRHEERVTTTLARAILNVRGSGYVQEEG